MKATPLRQYIKTHHKSQTAFGLIIDRLPTNVSAMCRRGDMVINVDGVDVIYSKRMEIGLLA